MRQPVAGSRLHNSCDFDAIKECQHWVKPVMVSPVLLIEYRHIDHKETDMHILALSTLLFQALATVALVLGAAMDSFRPARRARD